jgi:mannose/cellobiose epimerase-like protein (N-acyl-D-glucosamine 2-epimerase family)
MKKPTRGTHTVISHLSHRLLQRWVPKWHESFYDPHAGLFYERVNRNFKPLRLEYRRLLTQCRLLAVFSDALGKRPALAQAGVTMETLDRTFDGLIKHFHVPDTGGWRFSITEGGMPLDNSYDLYGNAFVIFALSHYYRASGNDRAQALAAKTLSFIDEAFRHRAQKAFSEALDEDLNTIDRPRRHESHMHLLEACLFAARTWPHDPSYLRMADELVDLFMRVFYDPGDQMLSEYFTADLRPQTDKGSIICEPGHYYEWIWLLKKHAVIKGDPALYDELCLQLLSWANEYGWDETYGGIYDELDPAGHVVTDTKRIWPFTEGLKANVLMLDAVDDKIDLKDTIARMVAVFNRKYIHERGFWTEWLTRDLKPATDYMPGTTPYHVYFGIMESAEVVQARGPSKSLSAGMWGAIYTVQRRLSNSVRGLRFRFKAWRSSRAAHPPKSAASG